MLRIVFVTAALAALSACASIPPNPINAEQRASLKVSEVKVAFADTFKAPNMTVRMKYFDKYKAEFPDIVAADKEANEVRSASAAKRAKLTKEYVGIAMREEILKAFAASPNGAKPATISLTVNSMGLSGGGMTILVGKSNSVGADAAFLDAATSEKIGSYDKIVAVNGDQGGLLSAMIEAGSEGGQADDAAEAYARELAMRFNRAK